MSYGEVWWFFRDEGIASLDEVLTAVKDAGLLAQNPVTGVPQILDSEGQQVAWDEADVRSKWADGETVTAQMWVTNETDVLVEMVRSHRLMTFDLDGMTAAEARLTVFAVLNAAMSIAGTIAVVGDRDLPDRGDELLAAVAGGSLDDMLAFIPDLLVSAKGGGHFTSDFRPASWLSLPAARVRFRD